MKFVARILASEALGLVNGSSSKNFLEVFSKMYLSFPCSYCNSRILMFSARGQMLLEINDKTLAKSRELRGFFNHNKIIFLCHIFFRLATVSFYSLITIR